MVRKKALQRGAAALLVALGISAAGFLAANLGVECGCQYGACGCRPIGTPYITPQQQTPLGPTLQPYTPYPIVTPALPQPATPALPSLPTFQPPRPPTNAPPSPPTPLPSPLPPTPFGLPTAPSLSPIGGGCPFLVQRLYPSTLIETYRVFFATTITPTISVAVSPTPNSVYGISYISLAGYEFYINMFAPYPPEYMTITITQGANVYICTFRRVY